MTLGSSDFAARLSGDADALLKSEKFSGAAIKFEDVLKSPESFETAGNDFNIKLDSARLGLAKSYFYSGQKERAVGILHEIIASDASKKTKSNAFIQLGGYFYANFDQQFAREFIFRSKGTEHLLDVNNVEYSVSNLYNEAVKNDPSISMEHYGRGIYYANQLLSAADLLSESDRDKYLGYVANDLERGDWSLSGEITDEDWSFHYLFRSRLMHAIQYTKVKHKNLSLAEEKNYDKKIKESFKTSIKMSEEAGRHGLQTKFSYISWMLMKDDKGGFPELKGVITDFYQILAISDGTNVRRDAFVEFLKNVRNYPEHHYYTAVVLIGKNSPQIGEFLVGIGWPREAFEKK